MLQKISVTVGIAAYNAENNIQFLLNSLLGQNQGSYSLDQIIVHCDSCKDGTVEIVAGLANNKIKLIESLQRQGFAGSLKKILAESRTQVTVLLNDDIVVDDQDFIEKLIQGFYQSPQPGLICGNPSSFPNGNFIQRAIASSEAAWDRARKQLNGGQNVFAVDGKVMAVSREFVDRFKFPEDLSLMGNVDAYLFWECKRQGLEFFYEDNAKVFYKNPTTLQEWFRWTSRNNGQIPILEKTFGLDVRSAYLMPKKLFRLSAWTEFKKNPLGATTIFILRFVIHFKNRFNRDFKPSAIWDVIESTKNIN